MQAYVRVTEIRHDGFIEFEFSLGDPSLYVELVLPQEAYMLFCANNKVQELSLEQEIAIDVDRMKWKYGRPGVASIAGKHKPDDKLPT